MEENKMGDKTRKLYYFIHDGKHFVLKNVAKIERRG